MKSIRIPFSSGIQNSDPSLVKNLFFHTIRCNKDHDSQISSKSKVLKIFGEFLSNPTHRFSLNCRSNYISNLDKFLWGKLFLISSSFYPYFIWNFWCQLGLTFDQISLKYFKLIQINVKPYCSSGLGHPAFFSGRPTRARALHRPTLCRGPPIRRLSPPLCPASTRAWRTLPTSAGLGPLPGAVRRSGPGHIAPPRRVAPPRPGPPPFPSSFPSVALPPSRSLPARAAPLVLSSPLLSNSFSRAPKLPHCSPHPDHRLQPPVAPSPSWIPAEHRRRPPPPSELLPELLIPEISCKSLILSLSRAAGLHHPHR
jgi:hypothetical protein